MYLFVYRPPDCHELEVPVCVAAYAANEVACGSPSLLRMVRHVQKLILVGFKLDKNGKIASVFSSELELVTGMTDSTSFFVYIVVG